MYGARPLRPWHVPHDARRADSGRVACLFFTQEAAPLDLQVSLVLEEGAEDYGLLAQAVRLRRVLLERQGLLPQGANLVSPTDATAVPRPAPLPPRRWASRAPVAAQDAGTQSVEGDDICDED